MLLLSQREKYPWSQLCVLFIAITFLPLNRRRRSPCPPLTSTDPTLNHGAFPPALQAANTINGRGSSSRRCIGSWARSSDMVIVEDLPGLRRSSNLWCLQQIRRQASTSAAITMRGGVWVALWPKSVENCSVLGMGTGRVGGLPPWGGNVM